MKKLIFTAILFSVTAALADIPMPPRHDEDSKRDVREAVIEGDAAAALWESSSAEELRGDSLRTGGSSHKVIRAKDGLDQVICTKTYRSLRGEKVTSYRCRTETSLNEEKLKKFVPVIRMGSALKAD